MATFGKLKILKYSMINNFSFQVKLKDYIVMFLCKTSLANEKLIFHKISYYNNILSICRYIHIFEVSVINLNNFILMMITYVK